MSDLDRQLHRDAVELCQTGPATPETLVALAHAGLKAWARVGNLQFPPEKRYALLQEIMRYCAWECLLACCFAQEDRLERIAEMLDATPSLRLHPHRTRRAPQPLRTAAF